MIPMKTATIGLFLLFVLVAILHAGFGLMSVLAVQVVCGAAILIWVAMYLYALVGKRK